MRVGIVGANAERGWALDAHIPALKTLPQFTLKAVSARNQSGANAAAAAFGAERAYGDSLALVRDPEIDVVAVTVKVPEHRAIVLEALEAGKHVYCEWPLGRNLPEAEEMAAAAARAGAHVTMGLQGPLAPAVRHTAELVRAGAIGRPLSLRVISSTAGWGAEAPPHYVYLQDKQNGATMSSITGGHTLASIEAVVGAFVEVDARNTILRETFRISGSQETGTRTSPDHILVIGRHSSGCVSSLEVIGGTASTPFRFELTGTAGRLEITGHHPGGYQVSNLVLSTEPASDPAPTAVSPALVGAPANVAEVWARLASDIRNGTRTTLDFNVAVRLTRLLDAIDTASDEGRRQFLGA